MTGRVRRILGLSAILVLVLGLGYAAWRARSTSRADTCQACGRAIHARMRTVAFLGDKREAFCCPTCALSAGDQMQEAVRFERLTDYETERPLRSAGAYAVEGSDLVPCVGRRPVRDAEGEVVPRKFDRCTPSIIAFASRSAAERFASEHGGRVGTFLGVVSRPAAHSQP